MCYLHSRYRLWIGLRLCLLVLGLFIPCRLLQLHHLHRWHTGPSRHISWWVTPQFLTGPLCVHTAARDWRANDVTVQTPGGPAISVRVTAESCHCPDLSRISYCSPLCPTGSHPRAFAPATSAQNPLSSEIRVACSPASLFQAFVYVSPP